MEKKINIRRLSAIVALSVLVCLLSACAQEPSASVTQPSTAPTEPIASTEPASTSEQPWSHKAALTNLLEETNRTGELLPPAEPEMTAPPGTLVDISRIPKASQNRIGETVSIILAKQQQSIPFYYACSETGEERLAVFINAPKIPMLVVFETKLGGIKGLYSHIASEAVFEGKILSMTNISWEEGAIHAVSACIYIEDIPAKEILTADTALVAGECIGIVGTDSSGAVLNVLRGGKYSTASNALKEDIDWMNQKFERYGIIAGISI